VRVIIAGSRDATPEDVRRALQACKWAHLVTVVVSGTAAGADQEGERWAHERGLSVERYPADWKTFGKRAGPLRNRTMAESAEGLIAVWDGRSRGTQNMIEEARERGLKLYVHRIDAKDDRLPMPDDSDAIGRSRDVQRPHAPSSEGSPRPADAAPLQLNAITVEVKQQAPLRVGRVPAATDSKDRKTQIRTLRERYGGTHLVRFDSSSGFIEVLPFDPTEELPGSPGEIVLSTRPELTEYLLFEWLHRALNHAGMAAEWQEQIHYLSTRAEHDVLAAALPKGAKIPNGVARRIATEFDFRLLENSESTARLILTIDTATRTLITCPVIDLLAIGFRPIGLYVLATLRAGRGGRAVGKVEGVDGSTLYLADHRPEYPMIDAAKAYLEPRTENLERLLRTIMPQAVDRVMENLRRIAAERLAGRKRLAYVRGWIRKLHELPNDIGQGVRVHLGKSPILSGDTWRPAISAMGRPSLVFAFGGTKTDEWNQRGLDRHGPYGWERFPRRKPNIAVICQAGRQSAVEAFVRRLLSGEPTAKYGADTGFLRRYRLDPPYIRTFATTSSMSDGYRGACAEALEHMAAQGKRWDLALVQIEQRFREFRGDDNPYLVTKALLLAKEVPVQQFTIQAIEKPPASLGPTLNNIGLAAYAKLGGRPWLLPVPHKLAHELVLGLGSFETTGSKLRERERYVGVTTVFSRDGEFLVESRTAAAPYRDYAQALLTTLSRTINTVRHDQGWNADDPVRLVFHAFKPLKDKDIEAVKQLMTNLGIPDAQFAFLHIGYGHPYVLFDQRQHGVGSRGKGEYAPSRGVRVVLSDHEAIAMLNGANEVKQHSDGMPRPILMRLDPASTYRDIGYLAQQVFDFSCLSWRSMTAVGEPVTMRYSKLIAENLTELSDVRGWVPELALGAIGRTRWFL